MLRQREDRDDFDETRFLASVRDAVGQIVSRQQDTGIDVVNDGQQGRSQYATYVKERLTGFDGERLVCSHTRLDDADFPDFAAAQTHLGNVMAGSDCGFGTSAWGRKVETNIAWAKLASMVEGARLASQELW